MKKLKCIKNTIVLTFEEKSFKDGSTVKTYEYETEEEAQAELDWIWEYFGK